MSNFREHSKHEWSGANTVEHINAGSLQRIADAAELMAKNHDALIRAKKSAEEMRDHYKTRCSKLEKRCSGLRGHITRLKRKSP